MFIRAPPYSIYLHSASLLPVTLQIIKLLTACVGLQLASVLLNFLHYAAYAGDGVGSGGLRFLGVAFDVAAMLLFLLLLILVAKGWTITNPQLTQTRLILITLAVVTGLYIVMYIADAATADPASIKYIYETAPGVLIILVRLGTLGWFLHSVWTTYKNERRDDKKHFYKVRTGHARAWHAWAWHAWEGVWEKDDAESGGEVDKEMAEVSGLEWQRQSRSRPLPLPSLCHAPDVHVRVHCVVPCAAAAGADRSLAGPVGQAQGRGGPRRRSHVRVTHVHDGAALAVARRYVGWRWCDAMRSVDMVMSNVWRDGC